MTYHRMHGKFANTYETASTRKFRYGRTETIRPLTADLMNFINAFNTGAAKELYQKFVSSHLTQVKECSEGAGFDRHFLGLQVMMKDNESHPMFQDKTLAFIKTFVLSTSNMSPAESYLALGFGPGCLDGYGINYAISQDMAKLSVSARLSSTESNPFLFRKTFHAVVQDMIDLLSNKSKL